MLTDVVPSPFLINFLERGNSCVILMNGDRFIANSMNRALPFSKSLLLFPGRYIMRDKCPSHCRYLWWWWWFILVLVSFLSLLSQAGGGDRLFMDVRRPLRPMLYGLTLSPVWKCCATKIYCLFSLLPSGMSSAAAAGNHPPFSFPFHKGGGPTVSLFFFAGRTD